MFFFQLKTIINVLISSSRFIWIPMLCVYGHYKKKKKIGAGIVFIRQNLTYTDSDSGVMLINL